MEEFKRKSFIELNKLSMEELCFYYRQERKHNIDCDIPIKGVEFKRIVHPLITFAIKQRRLINKQSLNVFINGTVIKNNKEKRVKEFLRNERGPIIFAITHTGKFDIELANEAIQLPYFLLSDDEEYMHRTIDGYITKINGVIYIDNDYESDQKVAKETIIKTINAGGNIMWYPERIWNLSPNNIILPSKFGIISVACETNARIVPVAIDQVDNTFNINIGTPFRFTDYKGYLSTNQKLNGIKYLRDLMATLKWQMWELNGTFSRKDIPDDFYEKFCEQKISEWPFITKEDIDRMVFKPKNIVTEEEAFEQINKIKNKTLIKK